MLNQGREHLDATLFKQKSIVILFTAADIGDTSGVDLFQNPLSLQCPYFFTVKRNIKVQITVTNDPVIGKHLNPGCMGSGYNCRCRLAVMGHYHQNRHALQN